MADGERSKKRKSVAFQAEDHVSEGKTAVRARTGGYEDDGDSSMAPPPPRAPAAGAAAGAAGGAAESGGSFFKVMRVAGSDDAGRALSAEQIREKKKERKLAQFEQRESEILRGIHIQDERSAVGRDITEVHEEGALNEEEQEELDELRKKGGTHALVVEEELAKRKMKMTTAAALKRVAGEVVDSKAQDESGVKMTGFNLDDERADGYYDDSGNFVWKKQDAADQDAWLDSLEEARPLPDAVRLRHLQEATEELDEEDKEEIDQKALYRKALRLVRDGESIIAALSRIGNLLKQQQPTARAPTNKHHHSEADIPSMSVREMRAFLSSKAIPHSTVVEKSELQDLVRRAMQAGVPAAPAAKADPAFIERCKQDFDTLTEVGDRLMQSGLADAYDLTYEDMYEKLTADVITPKVAAAASTSGANAGPAAGTPNVVWEYKWGTDGTQVFGPFSGQQMTAWASQGLLAGPPAAVVRRVGSSSAGGPKSALDELDADLDDGSADEPWYPYTSITTFV